MAFDINEPIEKSQRQQGPSPGSKCETCGSNALDDRSDTRPVKSKAEHQSNCTGDEKLLDLLAF